MNRMAFKTFAASLATGLGLLGGTLPAAGQTPPTTGYPGDWPNLGAFNNRQGRNVNPAAFTSGRTELRYISPSTVAERNDLILDNTDTRANQFSWGGTFDDTKTGALDATNRPLSQVLQVPAGGFIAPFDATREAEAPYVPTIRSRSGPAANFDYNPRTPSYLFSGCVPSAYGQDDPRVPATGSTAKYFEWNLVPLAGTERTYAVFAYLPVGTTGVNVGAVIQRQFPQRKFVYEIRFGRNGVQNRTVVDVLDTETSGNGFVRLGITGSENGTVFPSDGTPITVRLYNTVPRDSNTGKLEITNAPAPDDSATAAGAATRAQELALASTHLVYADAMRAQPLPGTFLASPTAATLFNFGTGTFLGNVTNNTAEDPTANWDVTVARTDYVPGVVGNTYVTGTEGMIVNYQANPALWPAGSPTIPLEKWRYSIAQASAATLSQDDDSAGTTATAGFAAGSVNPNFIGNRYLIAPVVNGTASETVTYAPSLADGNYDIYAYIPGDYVDPTNPTITERYATAVQYTIYEGATAIYTGTLDQSKPRGWVRLGIRRYDNTRDDLPNAPLSVVVSNLSLNVDAGRKVFADAIRFVGTTNSGFESTPVHATVAITNEGGTGTTDRQVVIVADQAGRIHCLDEAGNSDGTTTEYWSYPSTPDPTQGNAYTDPNLSEGIDGTINATLPNPIDNRPTATMPTSFNLSTAAIAHVPEGAVFHDLMYIGASNGRVYCIDLAGRGDYSKTTRRVGSARRRWTFPDDYDRSNPTAPKPASTLGAFRGSVVYGDTAQGAPGPTVYVPAAEGRIYAVDALGSTTTTRTTTKWRYPETDVATLPDILMTPTLFLTTAGNGRLFFGTAGTSVDDGAGRLYALDATTGDIVWRYNGGTAIDPTDIHDKAGTIRYSAPNVFSDANGYDATNTSVEEFGAFVTGVVAVPSGILDVNKSTITATTPTHVDELYALNSNRFMYAFNAETGVPITYADGSGTHRYTTNGLDVLSGANLTYTVTRVANRLGGIELLPMIVIPSTTGRLMEAFARTEDYNVDDDYVADFNDFPAELNSAAAANNFLFLTDHDGAFYALDDIGSAGNNLPGFPFETGVTPGIPPNDPRGRIFRKLKIKLMNKTGYNALRSIDASGSGSLTYQEAVNDPSGTYTKAGSSNPYAFEWGETAYVMVYGFPHKTRNANKTVDPAGEMVAPPLVNITFSIEGRTVRTIPVESRWFRNPATAPTLDVPAADNPDGLVQDGYAIAPFPFNNSGSNSIPPGNGTITASITTASLGTTTAVSEIFPDRRYPGSVVNFVMANPLAIKIGTLTGPGIGFTTNPTDPENLVNGTPNTVSNTKLSQLQASTGTGNHGTSATARVLVFDRSLIGILHEDGITNFRLQRSNLERQGGTLAVYQALDKTLYPGFEDLNFPYPNSNLDYPDIGREQVRAVKNANGNAENPILAPASLRVPLAADGSHISEDNYSLGTGRQLLPTPLDMIVDIPRYQPPVNTKAMTSVGTTDVPNDRIHLRHDSLGNALPQGYFGRVNVFIDSTNDSQLNIDRREAYRSFNLSSAVNPQYSVLVGTPTVDLGSLASGTGYSPLNPASNGLGGIFNPWNGLWGNAYRSIVVRNDGNINLKDLRLAKATNFTGNAADTAPWALPTLDNDPLAWMVATTSGGSGPYPASDLWSNIDRLFSAPNRFGSNNQVVLPKPRVTDRVPTELVANPYPRANPNLFLNAAGQEVPKATLGARVVDGSAANRIDTTRPSSTPKVAVSVPIGFPVGNYSAQIRVVENLFTGLTTLDNEILESSGGVFEVYSDPITLTYKIRETRMTNRTTPLTAPVIDDPTGFPNMLANPNYPQLGSDPFRAKASFRNAAPAAMRDQFGSLIVAYESDRGSKDLTKALPDPINPSLIYLSSLDNSADFSSANGPNAPAGNPPLWDLGQFNPATATQWFKPANGGAGYPASPGTYFGGGTAVAATVRFGSPSFPSAGSVDPLGGVFNSTVMGFVGNAQVSTATGRLAQSRVFVTTVSPNATGNLTIGSPLDTGADPLTAKGKPSVLQLTTGALVFYSETGAGQSGITVSRLKSSGSAFGPPTAIGFGDGFSSVFSPSAVARRYRVSGTNAIPVVELSFAGKLRGRPNAEVYLGRLRLNTAPQDADPTELQLVDSNLRSIESGKAGTPFMLLPRQTDERMIGEGDGVYRARGVAWTRTAPSATEPAVRIVQTVLDNLGNVQTTNLLVGNPTVERQSGLLVYDSRLGGKVYVDPELGIVRFAGGFPNRNAEIRISYTPTFLRVSPGGTASYSAVNGLFDARYIGPFDPDNTGIKFPYWFTPGSDAVNVISNVPANTLLRNDRYFYAYGRGAAGSGVTARPYSTTMRIGLRLPTRIATDGEGRVVRIQVNGALKPYQVDPANGRIYFQAEDEDRPITVTYTGVNEATNGTVAGIVVSGTPSFVLERTETPIAVDEAANDSAVTAFLDPFTYQTYPRPPLVWLFYNSTRAGESDLYFQTIAPRYLPFAK